MIENLVKMYKNGAITGYQVMIDSLHRVDPRDPGLVLGRLPDEILEEVMGYAKRYGPHRPHAAAPILPAEDQVRSAERWIQDHRHSRVGPNSTDGPHTGG